MARMSIFGGKRDDFRKIAEMSSVALVLPSSIAVGLFFGYMLDKWLHTDPWMLLAFLVLGIVSGFTSLFRALRKYEKEESGKSRETRGRGD
jgi:ATP synthase protein I